jgi:ferric-dicitrate binding protein FerR (iron transport regulator)
MSDSTSNDPDREGAAERVLRQGFEANALPPEALQRIRRATEQEWRSATHMPTGRRWRKQPAAASVAVVAAVLASAYLFTSSAPDAGAVLGELASFDAPGVVERRPLRRDVTFGDGAKLRVGQVLEMRGNALVILDGGGNVRVARATVIEVTADSAISLERGELYVDIPPGSQARGAFRVVTDVGEFRHEGTQFAVATVEGQTRLRVREGRVLWRGAAGDSSVPAGTEVTIDRDGKATRRSIATAGRDWAWMESMTLPTAIENRPLLEFLEYFARETGRKLVIDDAARRQAESIRMHGSVHGLTLTEALSAVMATTTLRYELPEGAIRVSSAGESPTPAA